MTAAVAFIPADQVIGRTSYRNGCMPSSGITAANLKLIEFPPVRYLVDGFVAEGLTLLAGKPKIGKSWLALDVATSIAAGWKAFGSIACDHGDVLYLALEDNRRRLKRRLEAILNIADWPSRLKLFTEWPRFDQGGLDAIAEWADGEPDPRLVIIDTLAMVRGERPTNESPYEGDYKSLSELRTLASERNLAVLVIHHVRKLDAEDPLDRVSGTTGLTGCPDAVLVLNRDSQGTTLYGRGRDIEEIETAMAFDKISCRWGVLGPAADVHRSDERTQILAALRGSQESLTVTEIAAATGAPRNNIDRLLFSMVKDGEVDRVERGRYAIAGYAPVPPGKIGKKVRNGSYA